MGKQLNTSDFIEISKELESNSFWAAVEKLRKKHTEKYIYIAAKRLKIDVVFRNGKLYYRDNK